MTEPGSDNVASAPVLRPHYHLGYYFLIFKASLLGAAGIWITLTGQGPLGECYVASLHSTSWLEKANGLLPVFLSLVLVGLAVYIVLDVVRHTVVLTDEGIDVRNWRRAASFVIPWGALDSVLWEEERERGRRVTSLVLQWRTDRGRRRTSTLARVPDSLRGETTQFRDAILARRSFLPPEPAEEERFGCLTLIPGRGEHRIIWRVADHKA